MQQATLHVLLALAGATSFVALTRVVDPRLGGVISTIVWGMVAVGSFETTESVGAVAYNDSTANGTTVEAVTRSTATPELGVLAVMLALVMLIYTFGAAAGKVPAGD